MKSHMIFNDDTNFDVRYGESVQLLDSGCVCEVTRFARSGETCICVKSSSVFQSYSPRLRKCDDAATLER